MPRQAPRRNQDCVKTQLEFCMLGMRDEPGLRGIDDAHLLMRGHRVGRFIQRRARLDLDESNQVAPPGDDIAWSNASPPGADELAALAKAWRGRGVTVERVLLDLHSGRIFGLVGKLVLDLIAVVMIVLSVSGLLLARLRARNGIK